MTVFYQLGLEQGRSTFISCASKRSLLYEAKKKKKRENLISVTIMDY
jgi:hypothetical protein